MPPAPFAAHNFCSEGLMRREACVISGVNSPAPPQKIFSPPPLPVDSTLGALLPVICAKRSAATVENGYTVDEPTILIPPSAANGRHSAAESNTAARFARRGLFGWFFVMVLVVVFWTDCCRR